ncbi:hypothetical protein EDD16DRAFT_1587014 [Pisolithus croceorrhizus]|nr:hypothetical protein EDD16DRAFT_1587014 [Pisolithus croceorrhizus]
MVLEAKKYKAEDNAAAARVQAKNNLESYAYNFRSSVRKLETTINETISWLDSSQEASKEEYDNKQMELQAVAIAIMQKLRRAAD